MKKIVVIIPAYNEEKTIKEVILDFWSYQHKNQYDYKIVVINNNSTDNTLQIAKDTIEKNQINGEIIFVKRQGKANAMRAAFHAIDADVFIMVDADSTYWSKDIEKFINPILNDDIDMVIGDRISTGQYAEENKRALHGLGNSMVKKMINYIFKATFTDTMTGYRGFSRRFVKNYPILCEGFELETEMSVFCLEYRFNVLEVQITYTDRPVGSFSKLNTYRDGLKVIITILNLFRNYKPLQFFSLIGTFLLMLGLIAGTFPVVNYIQTKYVTQVPMALLSVGLVIVAVLSYAIGLILSSVRRYQNINFEIRMLQNERHD
jgi:glycosyltransferase involved in cell wall biosynthesis